MTGMIINNIFHVVSDDWKIILLITLSLSFILFLSHSLLSLSLSLSDVNLSDS